MARITSCWSRWYVSNSGEADEDRGEVAEAVVDAVEREEKALGTVSCVMAMKTASQS